MCFEFGCFGGGLREDYGGERSAHKPPNNGGRRGNRRNYGTAIDHKAPPAATDHHHPLKAIDEAGHKAYHDGMRKTDHADVASHGGMHGKTNNDTPKLPAWHNKVGDDNGYYTVRPHEPAADRWQNAAMDYHQYPTTTANTTALVRY
jgi:hypothetical protein